MRYLLTLIVGLVAGGVLTFVLLAGIARSPQIPGSPLKPPDPGGSPAGTAVVVFDEKFFDEVLSAVFRDLNPPSIPLQLIGGEKGRDPYAVTPVVFQGECKNAVVLKQQGSNVRTTVRLTEGKITSPIAFEGTYNAPFAGCVVFSGWALASIQPYFDKGQQAVHGRVTVEGVNLDGAPPVIAGIVTMLVRNAINQWVNPLEILRANQLIIAVPVKASNGTLSAKVSDVRADVQEGSLRLHVTYEFGGSNELPAS